MVKPIKTPGDHKEALLEIEALSGVPEGSPEADRLEVLITVVEAYGYEKAAIPIDPPDPIDAIMVRKLHAALGIPAEVLIQSIARAS